MAFSIAELLKDSAYKLSQFKPEQISALESVITIKDAANKPAPYVTCSVRGKPIKLTPEEAIRQLYMMVLRDDLGYPVSLHRDSQSLRIERLASQKRGTAIKDDARLESQRPQDRQSRKCDFGFRQVMADWLFE